jgi:hypothetical protein
MFRGRQIRVEGTVVEAETPFTGHQTGPGPTHIILDVHTPEGQLVRVSFKQTLFARGLEPPPAGAVVPVDWDPKRGKARLVLKGDALYDGKVQARQQKDALKAEANAPAGTPSSGAVEDQERQDSLRKAQQFGQEAKRLKERHESGAITDAEFEQEKRQLLRETQGLLRPPSFD